MFQILRAFHWIGYILRRYVWDVCLGTVGFVFGWSFWQVSRVASYCWSIVRRVIARMTFHVSAIGWWTWDKSFGSQRAKSVVESAGQAQAMAMGLGAQKLHEISETSIWQRLLSFFPNVFNRILFALGFVGWWLWSKTFGSKVASVAAETAGTVPKQAIGFGLHKLDQATESTFAHRVGAVLRVVFWPLFIVWEFAIRWLLSRNYRMLRGGIPFAILVLPFFYLLVRVPFVTDAGQAAIYQKAAMKARDEDDEIAVALFDRKLVQLGVADARHEFYKALENEETIGVQKTYSIMEELAPHDREGFALAHRWIAIAISQGLAKVDDGQDPDKLLAHHLEMCLEQYPRDAVALQLTAARLSDKGDSKSALDYLRRIDSSDLPATALTRLATNYLQCNDQNSAEEIAGRASVLFEQRNASQMTADDLLLWAASEKIVGNYAKLADVLGIAAERFPDEQDKRFADVCVLAINGSWTDSTTHEKFYDVAKRAVRAFPKNEAVAGAIARYCVGPTVARRLRTALSTELDNGAVNEVLHGRIADQFALSGMSIEARDEYAAIFEHHRDVRIANNLAWLWATVKPTDMAKAIDFAEEARALDPNASFVLETRGQIFFMLDRYDEAKRDLTLAMNGLPNYEPIHDTLAKCYEKLGEPNLAQQHRQASERLKQQSQN